VKQLWSVSLMSHTAKRSGDGHDFGQLVPMQIAFWRNLGTGQEVYPRSTASGLRGSVTTRIGVLVSP
jgi:hypothetical protein